MRYSYLGYTVESCLALEVMQDVSPASPAVRIMERSNAWRSQHAGPPLLDITLGDHGDDHIAYRVFRDGESVIICIDCALEFSVSRHSIAFCRSAGVSDDTVRQYLLVSAFSLWVELQGCPVLHGSTVRTDVGAITFVAESGTGKSAMASAFLATGYAVLADDASVIVRRPDGFGVRPALEHLRLWPDAVSFFFGDPERWPLVDPRVEKRCVRPFGPRPNPGVSDVPLAAIVVLNREDREGAPNLNLLVGQDALRLLVCHSYCRQTVEAAGLQSSRLPVLAQIAATVPVFRLNYGGGFEGLLAVPALMDSIPAVASIA